MGAADQMPDLLGGGSTPTKRDRARAWEKCLIRDCAGIRAAVLGHRSGGPASGEDWTIIQHAGIASLIEYGGERYLVHGINRLTLSQPTPAEIKQWFGIRKTRPTKRELNALLTSAVSEMPTDEPPSNTNKKNATVQAPITQPPPAQRKAKTADQLEAGLPHFSAVPWALLEDPGISSSQTIAVYAALRRFADFRTGGNCFPSVATLAKLARCGERTVQQELRDLERLGWLRVERASMALCRG
jgi:hypothetical protein